MTASIPKVANADDHMVASTVVVAETCWGKLDRITIELLSDARKLASQLGGQVVVVLLCAPGHTTALLNELSMHVRETIHLIEHEAFEEFSTEHYLSGLTLTLRAIQPKQVFLAATVNGRDVGPRLAARLTCAYFPYCLLVKTSVDGMLEITRITHGGKVHVQASWPIASLAILTMKAGVADTPPVEKTPPDAPVLIRHSFSAAAPRARLKKRIPADPKTLDIREADRIVSGGRGVGSKQGFVILRSLADALGASLAASRAAVDLGWIEYDRQVGQTGKTVSPRLYLAAGISGASHHLMGMRQSGMIVAVNVDKQAPIFSVAHLGVVGDLHFVLPRLTEKIMQEKHARRI